MVKVIRQGMAKKDAAEAFGVSRTTVWKWCKRAKHRGRESFSGLPRNPKRGKTTKIEPLFAHPYYPQGKGKVERTIRNVAEEFFNLLRKFPQWLARISEHRRWYNEHRFYRGIGAQPAKLYPALI